MVLLEIKVQLYRGYLVVKEASHLLMELIKIIKNHLTILLFIIKAILTAIKKEIKDKHLKKKKSILEKVHIIHFKKVQKVLHIVKVFKSCK